MDLILWRHAEAEDGFPDMARKLTPRGHKQAEQMAAWLRPRLPRNVRILVSPATRTQQTAAALGMDFSTLESLAPGASAQDLIHAAEWSHGPHSVLIVGHQPTLGEVASIVLNGNEHGFSIKKSMVLWLGSRTRHASDMGTLLAAISPDML